MKGVNLAGANSGMVQQASAWQEKKREFASGGFSSLLKVFATTPDKVPEAVQPAERKSVPTASVLQKKNIQSVGGEIFITKKKTEEESSTPTQLFEDLAKFLLSPPPAPNESLNGDSPPFGVEIQQWLQEIGGRLERLPVRNQQGVELALEIEPPGLGRVGVKLEFKGDKVELRFDCGQQAARRIQQSLTILARRLEILGWKVGRVQILGARELVVNFMAVGSKTNDPQEISKQVAPISANGRKRED